MKTVVKKLLIMVLVLSIVCGVALSEKQYASAKAMSKVTKVVTLTKNNAIDHKIVVKKNEKVFVNVKILSIKGKAKIDDNGQLLFGDFEGEWGKGTLFASFDKPKLKKSSFKKGKVLKMNTNGEMYIDYGKTNIGWWVPDGVKNMKVQITYYTKSGKAGIKSLKQKERKW